MSKVTKTSDAGAYGRSVRGPVPHPDSQSGQLLPESSGLERI